MKAFAACHCMDCRCAPVRRPSRQRSVRLSDTPYPRPSKRHSHASPARILTPTFRKQTTCKYGTRSSTLLGDMSSFGYPLMMSWNGSGLSMVRHWRSSIARALSRRSTRRGTRLEPRMWKWHRQGFLRPLHALRRQGAQQEVTDPSTQRLLRLLDRTRSQRLHPVQSAGQCSLFGRVPRIALGCIPRSV